MRKMNLRLLAFLSELHYYLKVEHVFTPAEVEALLSFQDPLDVALSLIHILKNKEHGGPER